MNKAILTAAVVLTAGAALAVPGSVTTEKGVTKGDVKWSVRNKEYVIEAKVGKMTTEVNVPAAEALALDIQKPAEWDKNAAAAEKGSTATVAYFTKIMKDYAHLQWDREAAKFLTHAYLASGNAEKAYDTCKAIIAADPAAGVKGALAPAWWQCLIKLHKNTELGKALAKAAASGDRFTSGSALIARGDLILEGGETPDNVRAALTDGYLRVALMYTDADVAPLVRPEALYKAAKCFEKLSQAGRADAMRSELKRAYPASPWASK